MKYRLNLAQALMAFKNTVIWIIGYIIIVLYTYHNNSVNNKLLIFVAFAYVPFILPFIILYFHYLIYSMVLIKFNKDKLFINNNEINIEDIKSIERHQSITKEKKDNIAYLPWMAGTFYYYKINLRNGKKYYLTCFMDNSKKPFKDFIIEKKIDFSVKNRFYPIIY